MLRKIVLAGIVAGASASVPILHQNNPDALENLMRWGSGASDREPAAAPTIAMARPRDPAPREERMTGRKVQLVADARGHFTADFRLNGRLVSAMVDTGASMVAINQSTARRIGINLVPADFTGEAVTANGRVRAAGVVIESISVGKVEFQAVEAMVLEDRALSDTLIGMTFLKRLRRYHVENGAMVLEQ